MKCKYKYIYFVRARKQNPKTCVYYVRNDTNKGLGFFLGTVKWYPQWRQYAFYPAQGTVFEKTCLRDIKDFCIDLNERQALKRRKK